MINRCILSVIIVFVAYSQARADVTKQDGLTPETAVVVSAQNEKDGPPKEIAWIESNYPGSKILRFVTRPSKENKVYDVFFLKTRDGKKQQVYFEISGFYHKT